MGKQAKKRRRREGWGCTNRRFQPITERGKQKQQGDSDDDETEEEQVKTKGYTTTRALDNHRNRKKREKAEDAVYLGKKNRGVKRKDPPEASSTIKSDVKFIAGIKYSGDMQAFKKSFWPQAGDWSKAGPVSGPLKLARKALGIAVIGTPIPGPVDGLDDQLLPKIFRDYTRRNATIRKPTPVQAQVWPALLAGVNVVGIAPTGTGKTLAFLLPAVQHCVKSAKPLKVVGGPIALVLVPTRELALQIQSIGHKLYALFQTRCIALLGGVSKEEQLDRLMSPTHIMVATPGRLIDLLGSKDVSLNNCTFWILDEADRLFAMGFKEQLDQILQYVRTDAQKSLFSATCPRAVQESITELIGEHVMIRVKPPRTESSVSGAGHDSAAAEGAGAVDVADADRVQDGTDTTGARPDAPAASSTVKQMVEVSAPHKKPRKLLKLMDKVRAAAVLEKGPRHVEPILVFANKIKTVLFVADLITKHKCSVVALHSKLPQQKRTEALDTFRAGKVSCLVSTDVAARGLDIKRLNVVINYDMPGNLEQYVHRIGRVGRGGEEGRSFTFFTRNLAPMAASMIAMLKKGGHPVDQYLQKLCDETAAQQQPHAAADGASPDASDDD
eukprot:m.396942 g.396942  ORF g.396942 m.396942 type:complete len:613 (+) comp21117_c0_seq7:188-2026(+)